MTIAAWKQAAAYTNMAAMRIVFTIVCLLSAAFPAAADQRDPRLEPLFNQLAGVRTMTDANVIVAQIDALWRQSGSDTVDLLMSRAAVAVDAQDFETAKKLFDVIAEMRPRYAEVWYQRAELLLEMDSQQEAASDLSKVIDLEPRHFRALAIMGRLADQSGNRAAALAAYRKAVMLNPSLEAIARRAGELTVETERRPPI